MKPAWSQPEASQVEVEVKNDNKNYVLMGPIALITASTLASEVSALWCAHRGWTPASWSPEREPRGWRLDAAEIVRYLKTRPYPVQFWRELFASLPATVGFLWLTTPPREGIVCLAEERYASWQNEGWQREKHASVATIPLVGELARRLGGRRTP